MIKPLLKIKKLEEHTPLLNIVFFSLLILVSWGPLCLIFLPSPILIIGLLCFFISLGGGFTYLFFITKGQVPDDPDPIIAPTFGNINIGTIIVQQIFSWEGLFPTFATLLKRVPNLNKAWGGILLYLKDVDWGKDLTFQELRSLLFPAMVPFGLENQGIKGAEKELAKSIQNLISKKDFSEETVIASSLANVLRGDIDTAIEDLTQIAMREEESIEVRLLLAFCHYRHGSIEKVEERLQEILKIIRKLREKCKNNSST